ncbi:hypothetical protein KAE78_04825 [Microbacterium sp. NIBRBAC000506063]|nr:hypothetical protein [Microbacterium sp. NIBRBAC000506063]QTV80304.1 hypothetical protein KAE78_04825 [Microbacterium sp. NIBRBAC000506063]
MIGDEYGAITLRLVDAGLSGIRVHQDLATGRRALERNAGALGMCEIADESARDRRAGAQHADPASIDPPLRAAFMPCELDASLLRGARLVLLQLPKALAELEEIADAVARWAAPDVTLIAGGRVKHMTLAQNEVLGRHFGTVQPQRAEQKSRLLVATEVLPVPEEPPFPVFDTVDAPGLGPLTLAAHGAAFAGARLDIGTRVLLEALSRETESLRSLSERSETKRGDSPHEPHHVSSRSPSASSRGDRGRSP